MLSRPLHVGDRICLLCKHQTLQIPRDSRRTKHKIKGLERQTSQSSRRALHANAICFRPTVEHPVAPLIHEVFPYVPPISQPIRQHLQQRQADFGTPTEEVLSAFEKYPALDGTQNRLSKLSPAGKTNEDAATDGEDLADGTEDGDLLTIGLFLKSGDVVELAQPDREPILAVFVQQIGHTSQFFSASGKWCHSTLASIAFAITGCIRPTLLQPILAFMPTNPNKADPRGNIHVPADIAAPIRRALESLTAEAENIYRLNAPVLDSAYTVLSDTNRTRMMTLTQIAGILLGENKSTWAPTPADLLAVRKALHYNEFRFRSDKRSHRLTNVFAVRPKKDVETIETVHQWIRDYNESSASSENTASVRKRSEGAHQVADFLLKARRLIAKSRTQRDPNYGGVGPSKADKLTGNTSHKLQITWGEAFSASDKQIISFLQAWVLTRAFEAMPALNAACSSLLVASACYGTGTLVKNDTRTNELREVTRAMGMVFLQEIGVLSPFADRAIYDEQLMLPTVRSSRNLELLNAKAEAARKDPHFRDTMADLRRDWGPTVVYCIDDADAKEIDDGISIERVEDCDSEFWIHVHVANPTAFFDKTHTLSGLAAHMTETVYTPERAFPMLPAWVSQGYFSLRQDRPVITFSTRVDQSGEIVEKKIHNGIIRKVVNLTPGDLATIFDDETNCETSRLVVGGTLLKAEKQRAIPVLSPDNLQDLQDLYTTAKRLWRRREAAGGVRLGFSAPRVRTFENTEYAELTWMPPSLDRARFIQGDPVIELTGSNSHTWIAHKFASANIVEEMMILACHTAGAWCAERNVPVMYRGTIQAPNLKGASIDEIRPQLLSLREKDEKVPHELALRYSEAMGRAIVHSAPVPHSIIGVPSYVKATSPLRRFSDMIAHWQIEAVLRHEAASGNKFDGSKTTAPQSLLPFSQRQMQASIITLTPRERVISITKRLSVQFWATVALSRAFHYHEAQLPDVFKFIVQAAPEDVAGAYALSFGALADFGLRARMLSLESLEAPRMGDEWEVKLESIDPYGGNIYMRPVRLLNRTAGLS